MGLDCFLLVTGAGEAKVDVYSLETATVFSSHESAREWLKRYPKAYETHLPGEVREVWTETRLVLGGESMHDLNDLLTRLQAAASPPQVDSYRQDWKNPAQG